MLNKIPQRVADSIDELFRRFDLDPNAPGAGDELLERLKQPSSARKRGRPKGTYKLTGVWYLRLVLDAGKIRSLYCPDKLSYAKLAGLLKQHFPQRYPETPEWLRQCLLLHRRRIPSVEDFKEVLGANAVSLVEDVQKALMTWAADHPSLLPISEAEANKAARTFLLHLLQQDRILKLRPEVLAKIGALSPKHRDQLLKDIVEGRLIPPAEWVAEDSLNW